MDLVYGAFIIRSAGFCLGVDSQHEIVSLMQERLELTADLITTDSLKFLLDCCLLGATGTFKY